MKFFINLYKRIRRFKNVTLFWWLVDHGLKKQGNRVRVGLIEQDLISIEPHPPIAPDLYAAFAKIDRDCNRFKIKENKNEN